MSRNHVCVATPLFGGAMAADVPDFFHNMSSVLVVPDQQEVFTDDSGSLTVIFEVLEHEEVPNASAARFFLNDLADENGATSLRVTDPDLIPNDQPNRRHFTAALKGEFDVTKKGATAPDHVIIRLAVVRVPEHKADVVISMNQKCAEPCETGITMSQAEVDEVFRKIVESFEIRDYGLFI